MNIEEVWRAVRRFVRSRPMLVFMVLVALCAIGGAWLSRVL